MKRVVFENKSALWAIYSFVLQESTQWTAKLHASRVGPVIRAPKRHRLYVLAGHTVQMEVSRVLKRCLVAYSFFAMLPSRLFADPTCSACPNGTKCPPGSATFTACESGELASTCGVTQARSHGVFWGQFTPIFLFPPTLVVPLKICFKHIKTKIWTPNNVFCLPPNLETWLRAWRDVYGAELALLNAFNVKCNKAMDEVKVVKLQRINADWFS